MTGSDIVWWLSGLWYDLLHLGSADVPTLIFKLLVLAVVVFFGWQLGRMLLRIVWSVVQPVLRFVWMIVSAPVRLPWRLLKRLYRPVARARRERRWRHEERAEAERFKVRAAEEERQRQEALAAVRKILDVD